MKLLLMLVILFLQPCWSGSTSFILRQYPTIIPYYATDNAQYDDVTTVDVSLKGPEGGRRFERQTLRRLTSRMFEFKVKFSGPKSPQAFEFLNCSVSDSPFIELGRLASQLKENGVELSVLITATGRLGKTELPIDCAVDFSAECALDNQGKCNNITLTIPLSVVRSEADKNAYTTLAYLLLGLRILVVICMSCSVTKREVSRHLVGLGCDMVLCMAVSPGLMFLTVKHILRLPTNVQFGLMSIITSPYSCLTVTMLWVLQGNLVMGVVTTTFSFLVSILTMYLWVSQTGYSAPGTIPVPYLLGFWFAAMVIIIIGAQIRSKRRVVAQRIEGMMYVVGPFIICHAAVLYFWNLLPIYEATITKGMFLAPVIYLFLIGVMLSIWGLINRRALITSQRMRDQAKCFVLCTLLRDDMSAYLVIDQAPEEDQDMPACHVFVFTLVTLAIGLLLCVVRLVWVFIQRYRKRGFLWYMPDPAPADDLDRDGGIEADDPGYAADPNIDGLEMDIFVNPPRQENQAGAVNENQDEAVNENQAAAVNENQDATLNDNQAAAVNENQATAVNENKDATVNENHDVAVNENQDAADDQTQNADVSPVAKEQGAASITDQDPCGARVDPQSSLYLDADTVLDPNAPRQHKRSLRAPVEQRKSTSAPRQPQRSPNAKCQRKHISEKCATGNGIRQTSVQMENETAVRNRTPNPEATNYP